MSEKDAPKLHKCKRCNQSQAPSEYFWGYHFEPGSDHTWCRTCQFGVKR